MQEEVPGQRVQGPPQPPEHTTSGGVTMTTTTNTRGDQLATGRNGASSGASFDRVGAATGGGGRGQEGGGGAGDRITAQLSGQKLPAEPTNWPTRNVFSKPAQPRLCVQKRPVRRYRQFRWLGSWPPLVSISLAPSSRSHQQPVSFQLLTSVSA